MRHALEGGQDHVARLLWNGGDLDCFPEVGQIGFPLGLKLAERQTPFPGRRRAGGIEHGPIVPFQFGGGAEQRRQLLFEGVGQFRQIVIGPDRLLPLGLGGLFHQSGVGMETRIRATEGGELLVGGCIPDPAEVGDISCHAVNDRRAGHAFFGQLAHAQVHRRRTLAMVVYGLGLLSRLMSFGHRDCA